MEIKIKNIKNSLVVCPLGEIDHHSAEELKREIEKCCQSYRCKNIIIDFKGVTFMDSAGIGMIIGRYKYTHALGGYTVVTSVNETMRRIFSLSGLGRIIKIYPNIEEAINNITF